MISADATTTAALEARVKGYVYLVEMRFRDATLGFNTSAETFTVDGVTYLGAAAIVDFPPIQESEDQSQSKWTPKCSLTREALPALFAGDAGVYRNRPIRVYLQMLDGEMRTVGTKMLRWRGAMNKVSTERRQNDSNFAATLSLECTRPGLARARNNEGLRLTHQQQIQTYPNDRGLEYLNSLVNTPKPWLSVAFQEIK